MNTNAIPQQSYGILDLADNAISEIAQQIKTVGYAVLDSGYSKAELQQLAQAFEDTRKTYMATYGEAKLKELNEHNTIRSPLTHGGEVFLRLALNKNLLALLSELILGKFIINQQNCIINPPQETYNQAAWHRDLPYQHFVSSRPLAINALFCVDDFTKENGATYVLPASHRSEAFPSSDYIKKNAVQIEAAAGSFIVLDCMLFHAGGYNATNVQRRAINHVYNIPYFKQQINIPANFTNENVTDDERYILGFNSLEPSSISDYLSSRKGKKY